MNTTTVQTYQVMLPNLPKATVRKHDKEAFERLSRDSDSLRFLFDANDFVLADSQDDDGDRHYLIIDMGDVDLDAAELTPNACYELELPLFYDLVARYLRTIDDIDCPEFTQLMEDLEAIVDVAECH